MKCSEFIAFLDRYVGNELSADERARFDAHLDVCVACQNFLASYHTTMRLQTLAFNVSNASDGIPESVPGDLISAVLAAARDND